MFLHLSVILFTGGCTPSWADTPWADTQRQTPPGQIPNGRHPHLMHGGQVVDLRGVQGKCAPQGSKFFQFHAVFGKIWRIRMLAPPGQFAPPPRGNPGSATGALWVLDY